MAVLPIGIGSAAGGGTPTGAVERSLRFNSADSAYLNRTFGTPTNNLKWTMSMWLKRGELTVPHMLFCAPLSGSSNFAVWFSASGGSGNGDFINYHIPNVGSRPFITNAVYRDSSAWYHFMFVFDSANATQADRFILYVNGERQSASTASVSLNQACAFNQSGVVGGIGGSLGAFYGTKSDYFDGYLAEINFIDGQALTPSSFGETDSATGVWKPKAFSGTYGTNGFYLKFADNSGTTSTTLGKDSSGNGNNWTPNNFSVTAGAGNDSLVDTPTSYGTDTGAGGTVRGNYCTLNPLANNAGTLANGNLDFSTGATYQYGSGTIAIPSSGKWIFEVTFNTTPTTNNYNSCGVVTGSFNRTGSFTTTGAYGVEDVSTFGQRFVQNGTPQGSITLPSGTVIQCLIDRDAGTLTFTKNGTLQTGTGSTVTLPASSVELFAVVGQYSNSVTANFGQRPFAYTAPSGFKALCTQNLPTPTIGATSTTQAGKYFNPIIYTGNGTANRLITGVGFQPDFTWVKSRSTTNGNNLFDAVRGAGYGLSSNSTTAQFDNTAYFTAFASDGYQLGIVGGDTNGSGTNYVAWNWKANGAGSTNTAGTITSTVSANTTSGFSIVTYGGSGASGTVGHGLGVAPSMIIVKNRSAAENWMVYRSDFSAPASDYMQLNTTGAKSTFSNIWGGTATSSVFYLGGNYATLNSSGNNYVAYCFAPVAGYSAFGSYTGNGSADGVFVYTGFRPRFILFKESSASGNDWYIYDAVRSTYNVATNRLFPNSSAAELTNFNTLDILSNGWKVRDSNSAWNSNGSTYIYAAFAESPFKYSLAR